MWLVTDYLQCFTIGVARSKATAEEAARDYLKRCFEFDSDEEADSYFADEIVIKKVKELG